MPSYGWCHAQDTAELSPLRPMNWSRVLTFFNLHLSVSAESGRRIGIVEGAGLPGYQTKAHDASNIPGPAWTRRIIFKPFLGPAAKLL